MRVIASTQIALIALLAFVPSGNAEAAKASCQALIESVHTTRPSAKMIGGVDTKRLAIFLSTVAPTTVNAALEFISGNERYTSQVATRTETDATEPITLSPPLFVELPRSVVLESIRLLDVGLAGGERKACVNNDHVFPTRAPTTRVPRNERFRRLNELALASDPSAIAATAIRAPDLPAPQCAKPNVEAVATNKVIPETPDGARQLGATGTSYIQVFIDADGTVLRADLYASAGNAQLDRASMNAALQSKYAPELYRCHSIAGRYLYIVVYETNNQR